MNPYKKPANYAYKTPGEIGSLSPPPFLYSLPRATRHTLLYTAHRRACVRAGMFVCVLVCMLLYLCKCVYVHTCAGVRVVDISP